MQMIPQGDLRPPWGGGSLHTLATEKFEIRVIALLVFFGVFGNRFKAAVSVSPVSGFSSFLVNRNQFSFGDAGSFFLVLIRLAAILKGPSRFYGDLRRKTAQMWKHLIFHFLPQTIGKKARGV